VLDDTGPTIKYEYAPDVDTLYVYLAWRSNEMSGVVAYTIGCDCAGVDIQVDLSSDNLIFGFEILDAAAILPSTVIRELSASNAGRVHHTLGSDRFPAAFRIVGTDSFRLVFADAGLPSKSRALRRRLCTAFEDGQQVSFGFVGEQLVMVEVAEAERLIPTSARQAASIWPPGPTSI